MSYLFKTTLIGLFFGTNLSLILYACILVAKESEKKIKQNE
mgnify:CR=1 FL=1